MPFPSGFSSFIPSGQFARNASSRFKPGSYINPIKKDSEKDSEKEPISEVVINSLIIGIAIIIIAAGLYLIKPTYKNYCGTVIGKGYEANEGRYKHSGDPKYFIMLKLSKVNAIIRVNVAVPTWYNASDGKILCFSLSEKELDQFGNGDEHLIK